MKINNLFSWLFDPIFLTRIRLEAALRSVIAPLTAGVSKCLDVGCGDRPYEYLFKPGSYTGIDVQDSGRPSNMKQPDYFYDGKSFPFENEIFDFVISTQVLEHVPNPLDILNEMARVCKLGGRVVLSLPFVYPEHEVPFDYFRFTRYGIESLLKTAGFRVESMHTDTSAIETMAIMLNVYIMQNLVPGIKGISRIYSLFICFPIQIIAIGLSKILPDNDQIYLNLVIHAKKQG